MRSRDGGSARGERLATGDGAMAGSLAWTGDDGSRSTGRLARLALALVVLLGMLAGSGTVLPTREASAAVWVSIATDVVNVRETPNGTIIGQASNGQTFEVVGGPTWDNWYKIDYYGAHGFVLGDYLGTGAVSTGATGAPAAPAGSAGERWVDVDRSSQLVTLYEGGVVVLQVWGAMSASQSETSFWSTANGSYRVYAKEGGLHYTPYGRAWIRHWVAFDPSRDNGFHSYSLESSGAYAHAYNAPTGGCVALALWASEYLYNFVSMGTRVEVHW